MIPTHVIEALVGLKSITEWNWQRFPIIKLKRKVEVGIALLEVENYYRTSSGQRTSLRIDTAMAKDDEEVTNLKKEINDLIEKFKVWFDIVLWRRTVKNSYKSYRVNKRRLLTARSVKNVGTCQTLPSSA